MGVDLSILAQSRALAGLIGSRGLERPAIAPPMSWPAIVLRTHLLESVPFDCVALIDSVVLRPWITPTRKRIARCPTTSSSRP